jgi:ubiquinone/menaquinone biosynthesis C-methylase UbiE
MHLQTTFKQIESHTHVQQDYDTVQRDGRYEEGMAKMRVYHHYCQDPIIFSAIGDIRGKSLLDLACGDGFYTRRFKAECGADPVIGIDLSAQQIARAREIEQQENLHIEYQVGDVLTLGLARRFDVITAIHLLHYFNSESEIALALQKAYDLLHQSGYFVTMIANPEFDMDKHDLSDSKTKFAYYFSMAEPGNGGLMRFHPGGLEKEREITVEFRRWERNLINRVANDIGFTVAWHDPFINEAGLEKYGYSFFENYLDNPQSKLIKFTKA